MALEELLDGALARQVLLVEGAHGGHHGQAAVLQLLELSWSSALLLLLLVVVVG